MSSGAPTPLVDACAAGNDEEVALLLARGADPAAQSHAAIKAAAAAGHLTVVERLLADRRVEPGAGKSQALRLGATNGHSAVIERLLRDPRVHAGACNNEALRLAAAHGHVAVVSVLLASAAVDPAAERSEALWAAAKNGHNSVVALLLADGRVDAGAADNRALRCAAAAGHAAVVEQLLAARGVNPGAANSDALRTAAARGDAAVVAQLLATRRVNPSADGSAALRAAAEGGHEAVVVLLTDTSLLEPCQQPTGKQLIEALRGAADCGHASVVAHLLSYPKLPGPLLASEGSRILSSAFWRAREHWWAVYRSTGYSTELTLSFTEVAKGHLAVIDLLLSDPRVDPMDCDSEPDGRGRCTLLELASSYDALPLLTRLLAHPRVDALQSYRIALADAVGRRAWATVDAVLNVGLAHPSITLPALHRTLLVDAAADGSAAIVARVLADASGDEGMQARISRQGPDAVRMAFSKKHWSVLALLIRDSRIDFRGAASLYDFAGVAGGCEPNGIAAALLSRRQLRPDEADQFGRFTVERAMLAPPLHACQWSAVAAVLRDRRVNVMRFYGPRLVALVQLASAPTAEAAEAARTVLDVLLAHPSVQGAPGAPVQLLAATARGDWARAEALLRDCRLRLADELADAPPFEHESSFGECLRQALMHAAAAGQVRVLLRLLQNKAITFERKLEATAEACRCGQLAVVQAMLATGTLHVPSWQWRGRGFPLSHAAAHGQLHVVEWLLSERSGEPVDAAAMNDAAVKAAAENGHLAIVERLMADPRVDAFSGGNCAANLAFRHGHLPVVHRLLSDVRAWSGPPYLTDHILDVYEMPRWLVEAGRSLLAGLNWPTPALLHDVLKLPEHNMAGWRLRYVTEGLPAAALVAQAWERRRAAVLARASAKASIAKRVTSGCS